MPDMNYYEELGLPRTATTEEIREAYKRLVRLLHPDQHQADDRMRHLADLQLRRLNIIVGVLTDPEQRLRYDYSLSPKGMLPEFEDAFILPTPEPPPPPRPGVLLSRVAWGLAAAVGFGTALWYFTTESTDQRERRHYDAAASGAVAAPETQPEDKYLPRASPGRQGSKKEPQIAGTSSFPGEESSEFERPVPGAYPDRSAELLQKMMAARQGREAARKERPASQPDLGQGRAEPVRMAEETGPEAPRAALAAVRPSAPSSPALSSNEGVAAQAHPSPKAGVASIPETGAPVTHSSLAASTAGVDFRTQRPAAPQRVDATVSQLAKPSPGIVPAREPQRAELGNSVNVAQSAPASQQQPVNPARAAQAPVPQQQSATPRAAPAALPETRGIAGNWFYAQPGTPQNSNKLLYPPEFIELIVSSDGGLLRGSYVARYAVHDLPISPDVKFQFEGNMEGSTAKFPWTGSGGAKGEVQLKLLSESSVEVIWRATKLGKQMGLAAGTAILVRHVD